MDADFRKHISSVLSAIDPYVLGYHENEFWMIRTMYEYLEYFAHKHRMRNMAIALPLARGMHNGSYRKLPIVRGGVAHHPPYVIHCLTVCKMLTDFPLPLAEEEKDILFAAALCHDMIEDIPFVRHGRELTEVFHLDPRVYETVKLVSKQKDATEEQEQAYFQGIRENRLALLIKLSDRGHNVTDLYNMSDRKIREYIGETRKYFLPMCDYAREHYPEFADVVEILQDQLVVLTKTVEMMAGKHEAMRAKKEAELEALRAENEALRLRLESAKRRCMA